MIRSFLVCDIPLGLMLKSDKKYIGWGFFVSIILAVVFIVCCVMITWEIIFDSNNRSRLA